MAACKITSMQPAPSMLVTKILPAGEYICLSLPGTTSDLDQARMFLYHVLLPKLRFDLLETLEIEHLGDTKALFVPVKSLLTPKNS